VGHVVDEVVLHLRQTLLPEQGDHREDKGDQEDEREEQRGDEKIQLAIHVVPLCREIDPQLVELGRWIVREQGLRVKSHPCTWM